MKKAVSLAVSIVLVLVSLSCVALGEETKFVTIQEWLDAKGECGDCMLLLKIREVLNPVLAIGVDETSQIPLFSGGILEFWTEDMNLNNCWIVISNPKYNEYEGTIEMAEWTLLRFIPNME